MSLFVFLWIVSIIAVVLFIGMIGLMTAMAWMNKRKLEAEGLPAKAQIIELEIKDGKERRVPFVHMKINVQAEEPFVTTVEAFYLPEVLHYLKAGGTVEVLYHPIDKTCRIYKELPPIQEALQWNVKRSILPEQKLSAA